MIAPTMNPGLAFHSIRIEPGLYVQPSDDGVRAYVLGHIHNPGERAVWWWTDATDLVYFADPPAPGADVVCLAGCVYAVNIEDVFFDAGDLRLDLWARAQGRDDTPRAARTKREAIAQIAEHEASQ